MDNEAQEARKAAIYAGPVNFARWFYLDAERNRAAVILNELETNDWSSLIVELKNFRLSNESERLLSYESAVEWVVLNE